MNKEQFLVEKAQKMGMTLKGIASVITQSFEVESMTRNNSDVIKYTTLAEIKGGQASSKQVNDGNGWNKDTHLDGSLNSSGRNANNEIVYGTETSASPIDLVSYGEIKDYLTEIIDTYRQATGGVYHTYLGSTHVHNTISYMRDEDNRIIKSVEINNDMVYNNVARFFLKFMPVMKWLCMTDKRGGRGVRGTGYDLMNNDDLFSWWSYYSNDSTSHNSMDFLRGMGRDSYLRVMSSSSTSRQSQVHFENRMCDCTLSPTHLAMWLSMNKAITLFAIDFAKKEYLMPLTQEEVNNSHSLMCDHKSGYEYVNRDKLNSLYKEFVSYLAKYFKVCGSLEAIDVMDKLIVCPISQYINENGYDRTWNTEIIEKVFNTRNRASDTQLRDKFIMAIQYLEVKHAENLNEFLENMSNHLDVELKKVKSLYQMFKRENVDIEFLGGRLVYLGD